MRIAYYVPNPETISAGRTILHGYLNAWRSLGHTTEIYTPNKKLEGFFHDYKPDIFFTGLSKYYLKYLDAGLLHKLKNQYQTKVFVSLPFWKSPLSKFRLNETPGLAHQSDLITIIKEGTFGDVYTSICPQNDERMDGFEEETGIKYHTLLLAADSTVLKYCFDTQYKSDVAFLGTYLPEKRRLFREWVDPLKKEFSVRYYGQDWTLQDRIIGMFSKLGQYYNINFLRYLQKPKLSFEDEARIYSSTLVSINIHEEYQRRYGNDCNERTFKIPACRGFQIVDDVACIRKYFKEGEEIVIAKDKDDFQEKVRHFIKYPDERLPIMNKAFERVNREHTYHHRVKQLIGIYLQEH